jgi:hypothetical protein
MKMTEVFISDTKMGVGKAVNEIFSNLMKSGPILKSSHEVYIKVVIRCFMLLLLNLFTFL